MFRPWNIINKDKEEIIKLIENKEVLSKLFSNDEWKKKFIDYSQMRTKEILELVKSNPIIRKYITEDELRKVPRILVIYFLIIGLDKKEFPEINDYLKVSTGQQLVDTINIFGSRDAIKTLALRFYESRYLNLDILSSLADYLINLFLLYFMTFSLGIEKGIEEDEKMAWEVIKYYEDNNLDISDLYEVISECKNKEIIKWYIEKLDNDGIIMILSFIDSNYDMAELKEEIKKEKFYKKQMEFMVSTISEYSNKEILAKIIINDEENQFSNFIELLKIIIKDMDTDIIKELYDLSLEKRNEKTEECLKEYLN